MDLQRILDDYNYYRAHTSHVKAMRAQGRYVADVKMRTKAGDDRTPYFEELVGFCSEHQLDPKMWLYMLFKIRGWKAAPKFNQLVPKSKKTLQKNLNIYANLSDIPLFQKNRDQKRHQEAVDSGEVYDKNRDLGFTTEAIKRRYLNEGDSERCMAEMEERTFGYHPQSLVCARCPSVTQCAQLLEAKYGTHIIALRRGEITARQAQQLSLFKHGS